MSSIRDGRSSFGIEHLLRQAGACPVCLARRVRFLQGAGGRIYWRCRVCQATFLDPSQLPGPEEELKQYLLHENDPDDPRYRKFLSKVCAPLLNRLPPRCVGLDFGCGPGPALAKMLNEAGHDMHLYDPFFAPDPAALKRSYDFITCTEVAEHLHHPAAAFASLDKLLQPGGWLAVMTSFQTDDARFGNWHYRQEPSHVVFYRGETFRHLAKQFDWTCEIPATNVALMQKPKGRSAGRNRENQVAAAQDFRAI